jgi:hypothetical protein
VSGQVTTRGFGLVVVGATLVDELLLVVVEPAVEEGGATVLVLWEPQAANTPANTTTAAVPTAELFFLPTNPPTPLPRTIPPR